MLKRIANFGWCLLSVFLYLMPGRASAQGTGPAPVFTCFVPTTPPGLVRKGGVAEIISDIYITCSGGTPTAPGSQIPPVDFRVSLNVPVTSRTFSGNSSEALLIVNDAYPSNPSPASAPRVPLSGSPQNLCPNATTGCTMIAASSPGGDYDGAGQRYNVFQGVLDGPNSIAFHKLPLNPPGAGTLTLRITNIRADVSQLVSPFPLIPVQAFLMDISDLGPLLSNVQPTVANAAQGLKITQTPPSQIPGTSSTAFAVALTEGFATAFKPRIDYQSPSAENVPGFLYNTESGLWDRLAPPSGLPPLGLADHGTRLMLQFSGYPAGVKIVVPSQAYLGGQTASGVQVTGSIWYVATDSSGNGGAPVTPTSKNVVITTDSNGNGWAAYEVMASNAAVTESVKIPIVVQSQSAGAVKAVFAPLVSASATPIPRFAAQ